MSNSRRRVRSKKRAARERSSAAQTIIASLEDSKGANLSKQEIADSVVVDLRTIYRWADGSATPYPKYIAALQKLLSERQVNVPNPPTQNA